MPSCEPLADAGLETAIASAVTTMDRFGRWRRMIFPRSMKNPRESMTPRSSAATEKNSVYDSAGATKKSWRGSKDSRPQRPHASAAFIRRGGPYPDDLDCAPRPAEESVEYRAYLLKGTLTNPRPASDQRPEAARLAFPGDGLQRQGPDKPPKGPLASPGATGPIARITLGWRRGALSPVHQRPHAYRELPARHAADSLRPIPRASRVS